MPEMNDQPPSDRHVLIVDDSHLMREMIKRDLANQGIQCIAYEASNGEEALEVLDAHSNMALVLSDWIMPKMDGLALCDAIRQRYSKTELPLIIITTEPSPIVKNTALRRGANDWIVKPYDTAELAERVRQWITP